MTTNSGRISLAAIALVCAIGPFSASARADGVTVKNSPVEKPRPGELRARVPLPDSAQAWKLLPAAEQGGGQPLPTWARVFAGSLPRTAAAMLELDRLHRTKSPLGPQIRGKMRWIAADVNRCEYTRATAAADMKRAGLNHTQIQALAGNHAEFPAPERAALEFARKMTISADTVTDGEVAYLKSHFGEHKLVAMVLLLAYANFQDRLILALDLPLEPGGSLPPLEVRFDKKAKAPEVPARNKPAGPAPPPVPTFVDDLEWRSFDFDDLQRNLTTQRSNPGRIRVPSWEEVKAVLPAGYPPPKHPIRIQWSLVCMGYQPELAAAWSACTRCFQEEAKQDRVFEESLFWVVTRTIHCFY
jgi:alkylhydroperoxidase family enzyme